MSNKKAAAATKTVDEETGVTLEQVDPEAVASYLKKFGLPEDGPILDRVRRLHGFFAARVKKADRATCTCGGKSDVRLDACPFCGSSEVDLELQGKSAEADAVRELTGIDLFPAAAKQPAVAPVSPIAAARDRKRRRSGAPSAPAAEKEVEGAAEEAEQAPAEIVLDGDGEATPPAALVEAEDSKASVADLDRSVARVHSLVGQTFESTYDLGKELADCFVRKLWLQRRGADGKPSYSSWSDFVRKEVPCSVRHTYRLMDVSNRFGRDAFREYGVKKLLLLLSIPEDDRPAMLEPARSLSVEQLRERVVQTMGASRPASEKEVGGSNTDVGKAIAEERWSRAAELLEAVAKEVGCKDLVAFKDDHAAREPVASRLGVDVRTVRRWMAALDANGAIKPGLTAPSSKAKKLPEPEPAEKAKAAPPAEKAKAAPPREPPILAVPMQLGKTKLPLFARPLKKGAPDKRAKRLADDPWATEHHENGVATRYSVQLNRKGELELVIDRVRS